MKYVFSPGDRIVCYLITHGGEGERGNYIVWNTIYPRVPNHPSGEEAAEWAANELDCREIVREGIEDAAYHDTHQTIEVTGIFDVPVRYHVSCEVKREYKATKEGATDA